MVRIPRPLAERLVRSIHARPYLWLLATLAVTVLLGFAGTRLTLNSKIQDLLPTSAPSVQAMEVLQKRLGSADILVVTLMADEFEPVIKILPDIAAALERHPDVSKVVWRQDVSLIERNALTIFPTVAELQDFEKELSDSIREAVSKKLQLFDDDEAAEGAAAEAPAGPQPQSFTWGEHEDDDGLSEFGRTFRKERGQYAEYFYNRDYTTVGLQVYPSTSSSDLAFCRRILAETEELVRAEVERLLGPIGEDKVVKRIDLGGGYRDTLKESDGIKGDLVSSAAFSFSLLTLVVIVFFRSFRAVLCVMVPVVVSTVWLIGFVALTIGYLNLLTAFIFAVLLGLGIDFGIHFYGRFREERAVGHDNIEAMVETLVHCGEASLLSALTTVGAFLALTLADFRGFSQFGGVAAVGVLLCLMAVFFVFPAIMFAFERWFPLRLLGYTVGRDVSGNLNRRRFPLGAGAVVVAVLIGLAGAVYGLSTVQFELDFDRLGPRVKAEEAEYRQIQNGTVKTTVPAVIFADTSDEAHSLYRQLRAQMSEEGNKGIVRSVQALFTLVPEDQDEKQKLVARICRKLGRKVRIFDGDARHGADQLLRHCNPETFTVADLPDWVRAQFSDRDGRMGEFIFVAPNGSISDGNVALSFREAMLSLKGDDGGPPLVSGKPMIWADVIIAMRVDGSKTSIASFVVVVLLMLVFMRSVRATTVVLLPLLIAVGVSAGLMGLLDIRLNFFNMLALPTTIGMGVDSGVHMYSRHRELGPGSGRYIVSTTGFAVMLATLTTAIGFGSLLTANHFGLNSLGFLTILGLSVSMVSCFLVVPAALQWIDDHAEKKGDAEAPEQGDESPAGA